MVRSRLRRVRCTAVRLTLAGIFLLAGCDTSTPDALDGGTEDAAVGEKPEGSAGEARTVHSDASPSDAGPEPWLEACRVCATETPACSDNACLRCIFVEPRLSNAFCPDMPDGFMIESFAILNAECGDVCPSP